MNERIRELAEQALRDSIVHDGVYRPEGYAIAVSKTFAEKLVELIVAECVKESMGEIVDDEEIAREKDPLIREYLRGNNQGIVDAVVRFRNHFGVEE